MASNSYQAQTGAEDDTTLICPICCENFVTLDPRVTPCLHIVCLSCLKEMASLKDKFVCPICRYDFSNSVQSLDQLPVETSILAKVAQYRDCDSCEKPTPASHKCKECQKLLCRIHADAHLLDKDFTGHNITETSVAFNNMCPTHSTEFITLQCSNCNVFLCGRCDMTPHAACKVVLTVSIVNENLTALTQPINAIRKRLEPIDQLKNSIGNQTRILRETKAKIQNDIKADFDEMIELLTKRRETLLSQANTITAASIKALELHSENVNALYDHYSSAVHLVDRLKAVPTNTISPQHVITLRKVIESRLLDLQAQTPFLHTFPVSSPQYSFDRQSISAIIDQLGLVTESASLIDPPPMEDIFVNRDYRSISDSTARHFSSNGAFPQSIAFNPRTKHLVVVNQSSSDIQLFEADGTHIGVLAEQGSAPGFVKDPCYVSVGHDGNIWVADFGNNRVQCFTETNGFVRSFDINSPVGIAVFPDGNVLVGRANQMYIYTPQGVLIRSFGSFGGAPGQFNGLEGLALTPDGQILVADSLNNRIQLLTAEGQFVRCVGDVHISPTGLAVAPSGEVIVVENGSSEVAVFEIKTGRMIHRWSLSSDPSNTLSPYCVALLPQGSVYVTEITSDVIYIF